MRRIGYNLPDFFTGEVIEQAADARKPHEFVARSDHREHGRGNRRSFAHRRQREFRHSAKHFRPDAPHHQRVPDQANGGGRCQLSARQAFEHDFRVAGDKPYRRGREREQALAKPRSKGTGRDKDKPAQLRKLGHCGGMDRNGAAQAFTENEKRRLASGAVEQHASGVRRIFRHA